MSSLLQRGKAAWYLTIFALAGAQALAAPQPAAPARLSAPQLPAAAEATAGSDWPATLARIANSVVTIEVDQTRSFDTERNTSAQATGFVVDAVRGLILTNRHVVTPGPVTSEATFLDREEVQLYPVYRDPVHDFGLYHYDPAKLHYLKPEALPLAPEFAEVGREIRVVGNNAGEQLSILAGTLAKLDREAPDYGVGRYNDFNTFYLQAASGTSGGSSGSPVVDVRGRVLALNAGGANGAASSFYLPLGRVKRALGLIQQGKAVPRGTLQTEFRYRPYDELRRLGLRESTEAAARAVFPANTGLLIVGSVQPGSAADGVLAPGDVLVRLNGRLLGGFEPLEAVLDDSVGGKVTLELERGGQALKAELTVDDLHAITPATYLEISDAILHDFSYQQARHFNRPISGVFVASPGYMFDASGVPRGAVITQVGEQPVANLDALIAAIGALGDGAQTSVRYFTIDDPNRLQLRLIRIDRRWFAARRCARNDQSGLWDCQELPAVPPAAPPAPARAQFAGYDSKVATRVAPSLVGIGFDMPYAVSGVNERNYRGTGLVLDSARGLVITDRNTIPVALGDVRLTFAGTVEVPGKVLYIHPLHNLAVVQYDPALLDGTEVRSAELDTAPLKPGEDVSVVGLDADGLLQTRATAVAEIGPLDLPLSRSVRFRESNIEVASLVNPPEDVVGVLASREGKVRGLWASFASDGGRELVQESRGIDAGLVADVRRLVTSGAPLHSLEVEFATQSLAIGRRLGLPQMWLQKLSVADPRAHKILSVARTVAGSDAARQLQTGDLLLAVDGATLNGFAAVERAVTDKSTVRLTIWREHQVIDLDVQTAALGGADVDRVVEWAGATLQSPHRAIAAQRGIAPTGVYVAYYSFGSPATRFGLTPGQRIVEVDGQPTPDLDSFLKVVAGRADRSSLRLRTLSWNNASEVITLKLDRHYWPTYELRLTPQGWQRKALE